jgi:CRP/FNR family transcriptional regulator, cyclic AMP receptor protein
MTEFEKFCNISILKEIEPEKIRPLFDSCRRCQFEKGELIMEEGEESHSMFFFIEGEAVVTNVITMKVSNETGYSEVEKSLVRLRAEQVGLLGEMTVFEEQPRSASVKAFDTCVLYEIDKKGFEEFIARYTETGVILLRNIAAVLCSRIRRANKDVLKLTTALSIALSR